MSVIIEFLIRKQTCNTQGNTKKSTKVFTGIYMLQYRNQKEGQKSPHVLELDN